MVGRRDGDAHRHRSSLAYAIRPGRRPRLRQNAPMTRIIAVVGSLIVLGVIVVVGTRLLGPVALMRSTVDPDVTVECAGGTDPTACIAWGDGILADGSPTTTFEAEDVVRLRLDRALLGFGDTCRAEWFLGRYPDDVAWSEEVDCPAA
jgi:hypothetical protein